MNLFLLVLLVLLTSVIAADGAEDEAGSAYLRGGFAQAAATWSRQADRGDPIAQYDLGCMIANGKGLSIDRGKAAVLFQRAADGGDLDARKWIESAKQKISPPGAIFWYTHRRTLQEEAPAGRLRLSYRVLLDGDQEFVALCRTDADGAAVDFMIGLMLETGKIGLPADEHRAAVFFERASVKGYAAAQTRLAYFYLSSRGVTPDAAKAVSLFRSAAEKGDAIALSNLAHFFETGALAFPRDSATAYALYSLAAARGDANLAPRAISVLSARLSGDERKRAVKLKACLTRGGGSRLALSCLPASRCAPTLAPRAQLFCR